MPQSPPLKGDAVVIAENPGAGARSAHLRVESLRRLLEASRLQVEVHDNLGAAVDQARRWHDAGRLQALVAAGGDGTAAELVNRTPAGMPLALLPSGTENLLARHLKIDGSPEGVQRTILGGRRAALDVGSASRRLFLLMASCGFDAEVVRRVHAVRRGHFPRLNWVKPIVAAACRYPFPPIRVYWEQVDRATGTCSSQETVCRWAFVFNLPCYARGLPLAPQADGTDGLLDMCLFQGGHLWNGLRYAAAVSLGRHQRLADCCVARFRRLKLVSEEPVPYQLDGDPGGQLPLEIEIVPDRLTILVPDSPSP